MCDFVRKKIEFVRLNIDRRAKIKLQMANTIEMKSLINASSISSAAGREIFLGQMSN